MPPLRSRSRSAKRVSITTGEQDQRAQIFRCATTGQPCSVGPRALPAPGASQYQQSVQYSRIGVGNVDYLCSACCSRHQRHRVTADAKRLGYRGQGGSCGLTTYRTGCDPDYQRAAVLAADASMG